MKPFIKVSLSHIHKHSLSRRELVIGSVMGAISPQLFAQKNYPDRPIKTIVPNSPGSSVDTIGRLVMSEVARLIGQPLVIDNRAGAAGAIGVETARAALADGYTVLIGSSSAVSVAPFLQKAVTYQPLRDFDLIALMALLPNVLVCHPNLPVNSVTQFLTYARNKNGDTKMASAGMGSASHLAGAALQVAGGFESLHVPYRGGSQGVASVVSGETDWVLTPAPAAMSLVAGKRLKLLGHSLAPALHPLGNTPSIGSELQGFEFSGWIGLMGPTGLPASVVSLLNKTVVQALQSPTLAKAFETHGAIVKPSTPEEFKAYLTKDVEATRRAVQAANIKPE